jgi:hypothetical protein
MGAISGGKVIPAAAGAVLVNAGAPSAGADEVQTILFGGTPTGGTFTLTFDGHTTSAITWSSTNATLVSNIDTALEALPNIGSGGVTTGSTGTLTNGIGTVSVTFAGANVSKLDVATLTYSSSLTGTNPTITIAESTVGTLATGRGAARGAVLSDSTNGKLYIQTASTPNSPTWTVVGGQS